MAFVDTSMYQNLTPVNFGNIANGYEQGLKLKQMGQQQQAEGIRLSDMQRAQQSQILQRGAFTTDPTTGQPAVDPAGYAAYAKFDPMGAISMKQQQAGAQLESAKQQREKGLIDASNAQDQASKVTDQPSYDNFLQWGKDNGHLENSSALPSAYDPNQFKKFTSTLGTHAQQLAEQHQAIEEGNSTANAQAATATAAAKTAGVPIDQQKANIEGLKAKNEAALLGPKLSGELYGRSSPTNAMAGEYDKEVQPIRSSQIAMRQMLDNYNNPSPQGDKSLILNAFKIKFPTAPDVNSLEELSKAQGLSDQWKNAIHSAASGGLDQNTRDNLMRDGVSTYRANYGTYQDIAQRYQGMAKDRGVPLGGLTNEPSLDNTFSQSQKLQGKLGPYVPPSERGGIMSSIGNILGSSGTPDAGASKTPQYRSGSVVMVGGKHYTVGADGDSLTPVQGKR